MEVYTEPAIIGQVSQLLRVPIPRAGEDLESHIIDISSVQYDVAVTTANTLRLLHEKRKQLLWPKDKDLTELDRKTKLDADTAMVQRDYELLIRIEQLISSRLLICMQLLH